MESNKGFFCGSGNSLRPLWDDLSTWAFQRLTSKYGDTKVHGLNHLVGVSTKDAWNIWYMDSNWGTWDDPEIEQMSREQLILVIGSFFGGWNTTQLLDCFHKPRDQDSVTWTRQPFMVHVMSGFNVAIAQMAVFPVTLLQGGPLPTSKRDCNPYRWPKING